jgi:cobalt-zinc-cadmium efflux system outer membrane protein
MFNVISAVRFGVVGSLLSIGLAGCTVHPPGERELRSDASKAGKPYEKSFDARSVEPLSENATLDQMIAFALVSNADLEERYWGWRAAIEQIPQDGTQSTSLNISAGTSITRGKTGLGSSTLTLANDPMTDIKWPGKLDAAAKQTLENARASGERFLKAKYELRSKVVSAYYDLALSGELIRLEENNLQLLSIMASTTEARSLAGGAGQQDVMKANNEEDLSRNEITNLESEVVSQRAALNSLLGRPAEAPLTIPPALTVGGKLSYRDDELLDLASKHNPELTALADEIRGKREGIRLAKIQYFPDFNLSGGTDLLGITQSLLAEATIPVLRYEALNAGISQAEANLRSSEAMTRQTKNDLASEVVSDIEAIRDSDRELQLLDDTILPRTRQIVNVGRSAYENGRSSLLDLLDSERSLIAIERLAANLKVVREKHLADLESVTTSDLSHHENSPTL